MKPTDLKGFDFLGTSFSWPEFDEFDELMVPGHAYVADQSQAPNFSGATSGGRTACEEPWPHVFRKQGDSTGYVPKRHLVEQIKKNAKAFLCKNCLAALGLLKSEAENKPEATEIESEA